MLRRLSGPLCYLFALGLSLAGHSLLLQLPVPRPYPVTDQPLAADAANFAVTDIAVVSLLTPTEQSSELDQPPPVGQSNPASPSDQSNPPPIHQPTSLAVPYINREDSTSSLEKSAAAVETTSPTIELAPTDDSSAKPAQFHQFWAGLSDRTLDAGSLAETLELFGTSHQAALFLDQQGEVRSHLETFVLLPRHSPTQALHDLVQPQLIATATCDVSALTASPHQQAGGGAVYATQCGPLRQYLNLVPLGGGGTLVVLWGEEP